jgi:hypothetical protein
VTPGTPLPEYWNTPGRPGSEYGICKLPGHAKRGCTGLCDFAKILGGKDKLWEFLGGESAKRELREIMDEVSLLPCTYTRMYVYKRAYIFVWREFLGVESAKKELRETMYQVTLGHCRSL